MLKTVREGDRVIANIHTSPFEPWLNDAGEDTGQSVLQLNRKLANGVGFHVYRMAPGTTTTPHQHTGDEEFFLLEGDLTDNDGTEYQVGDLVLMRAGTEHFSTSREGCTLLVYIPTAEQEI